MQGSQGSFRILILNCTFTEDKLFTLCNGEYNDSTQSILPLFCRNKITTVAHDESKERTLAHFWPGNMPSEHDKPFTSVRHIPTNWNTPTAENTNTNDQENNTAIPNIADTAKEQRRHVTFTYPPPATRSRTGVGAPATDAGKKKAKGKQKSSDGNTTTDDSSASRKCPSLIRLPMQPVSTAKPSSHALQRSQPFALNEQTMTELANSKAVVELWAGEEQQPGSDTTTDKLIGSGNVFQVIKKLMYSWPQHFEEEVTLKGLNCGTSSPRITVRIVPDSALLEFMREARLLTIKNPGLSSLPPSWVWNMVPTETNSSDPDKKGQKDKDKKGGDANDLPFPDPNAQYMMGISVSTSTTFETDVNAPATTTFHGGTVNSKTRCDCSKASGYIGKMNEDDATSGATKEPTTLSSSPDMLKFCNLVSWEKNPENPENNSNPVEADFFVSAKTIDGIKRNNTGNKLYVHVQVARLESGYSNDIDASTFKTCSLANALETTDPGGLASSGTIEIFAGVVPLDALFRVGVALHSSKHFLFQKQQHFESEKKQWLSLVNDEALVQDQSNAKANAIVDYVRTETEKRMNANEDDEIDDSDLLPLAAIKNAGEMNPDSLFSRLFLPFNTIDGGGPKNQPILPSQPLNGCLDISINKPIVPVTSECPQDTTGTKVKTNRTHAGENEQTLRMFAVAEQQAKTALSNEMKLLEEALAHAASGHGGGGASNSRLNLTTEEYESFRERIKTQMINLLKAQLGQTNDVNQDRSVATSLVTSVNPLESKLNQKMDFSSAIAHTKRTAKNIVQHVFSSTTAAAHQPNKSKIAVQQSQQRLMNGWQSLVENVPDRAIKQYAGVLGTTTTKRGNVVTDTWYGLAQANIKKGNLSNALECLNTAIVIDNEHVNALVLRTLVEAEQQYSTNQAHHTGVVVAMDSMTFLERAAPTATIRNLLVAMYRLSNNDTRALHILTGDGSPWNNTQLIHVRPQSIVASLHGAARYMIDQNLMQLAAVVLDLARAEERNVEASSSNIYPLARAIREAAYRSSDTVIAHVRDLKGRHVGLWCLTIAVRASLDQRATALDEMKTCMLASTAAAAAVPSTKKGKKNKKNKDRSQVQQKDSFLNKKVADERAAESASEAAKRACFQMMGSTLDVQHELEYLTASIHAPPPQKCETRDGRVRFALAQFRKNNADETIQSNLIGIADKGNRTGVLWSRDHASTYLLAWRALENVNEHASTSRSMFEFLARESPSVAGVWMGLGLCQMYNSEYDLAQKSFERACSLDGVDVRNWLGLGCNALCRGDAGVKDAELAARRLEELHVGETIRKENSTICTFNLLEDFLKGCEKHSRTKKLRIVSRYRGEVVVDEDGGGGGGGGGETKRPSTVPTF